MCCSFENISYFDLKFLQYILSIYYTFEICKKIQVIIIQYIFVLQWMYIVPALIFVVLTSAANPEPNAPGNGNGGGGNSVQRQ